MAEGPSDPDFDLLSESGRENFKRFFGAEERSIANTSSKASEYGWIRKAALAFFQTYYDSLQSDAVIPYTAVTFVDRVYLLLGHNAFRSLLGHNAIVDEFSSDNYKLLFTYCLYRSWRLRTDNINAEKFLSCIGLDCFTRVDVQNVEKIIPIDMDWSSPITPFFFVEIFAPFLTLQPPTSALRSVYQLIVSSQYEIACTQFRPSVIALSSILVYIAMESPHKLDSFKSRVSNQWLTSVRPS